MPELSQDPIITIRDLIVNNWDSTNLPNNLDVGNPGSGDIYVHTGWFLSNNVQPQITVTNPEEFPLGGGTTGFRGQDGSGTAMKLMIGTINVGCWAHKEDGTGLNPQILIFEMSEEVRRIIKANQFPGNDLEWISWTGRRKIVDTQANPTLFRFDIEITYMYEDRV